MNSKKKKSRIFIFCLLFTISCSLTAISGAEIVDRIVASVNDDVITLSEFNERSRLENRDEKEVLEGMINGVLLLSEAKRLGLAGREEDKVIIERLIDRRIRAFILIPLEKAMDFYETNRDKFGGKEFLDVRDEINHYLIEEETNKRLEKYLQEIREKATIKIFY